MEDRTLKMATQPSPAIRCLAAMLLALLVCGPLTQAQETMLRQVFDTKTDTHVEVLALFSQPSRGGYLPVRVKVANNLTNQRQVRLDFTSAPGYFGSGLQTRSSFTFNAPPGKTVVSDVMVPTCAAPSRSFHESTVSLHLTGSLGETRGMIQGQTADTMPGVLLSQTLHTPNASALDSEIRGSGSSRGSSVFAGSFDPKQLPDQWLAFSGYDSVLMTDGDWSTIPAGARNAILSWVRLGGQLVIFSPNQPSLASLGIPENPGFGSCRVEPIGRDLKLSPGNTVKIVSQRDNPVRHRHTAFKEDFSSSWPLQDQFGVRAFEYGLLIAVLIIFSILVGPVNLFYFAKSGKRHRLFITTPLISLGTSLLLIAMIIFQDGFGGDGMRRVLMEVSPDNGGNAAYLHQEQFSRAGILTRTSFNVDPACFLTPVPIAKSRWARFTTDYNTRGNFLLQPNAGKLDAAGDWWQSRSEHGHSLSAVVATRGRIESSAEDGVFVSTFDFPIKTFYYLDEENQWHKAEDITTGKPFRLRKVDGSSVMPVLSREAAAFTARNNGILNRAIQRPSHFVAITGEAPAIDTHPGIRWKETRTIITGSIRKSS